MARTKKFLKAPAVALIRSMIESVVNTPELYNQNSFPDPQNDPHFAGVCTTPFCAAGHIINAKSPKLFAILCKQERAYGTVDWVEEAMKVLRLSPAEVNTSALFGSTYSWPVDYREMYLLPRKTMKGQARQHARAFAAYWNNLIDTDLAFARY